jgi:hypothetical protein
LEEHWPCLEGHCSASRISTSVPTVPADGRRALVSEFDLSATKHERILRSAGARILLKADISRYYPTIYTHSIPWAIHGKDTAKKDRTDALFGNQIDKCIRSTQDGQTIGIPIGPDSSYLIGEVIGSSIDEALEDRLGPVAGTRYIDDFWLYFPTQSKAEEALATLHTVVRSFELEINDLKTEFFELPEVIEPVWVTELRGHRFRDKAGPQHTDLVSFFSRAFDFARINPTDSVLTYALKVTQSREVATENWPLYESLLLNSILAEPSALPVFAGILAAYRDKATFDFCRIATGLGEICAYHAALQHGWEVAWSSWIARQFGVKLPADVLEKVARVEDPAVALAALDLIFNGTADLPDVSLWLSLMTPGNLFTSQWLLAYEALIKGWLPSVDGGDYVAADGFFGQLKALGVEFYNTGLAVEEAEIEAGY